MTVVAVTAASAGRGTTTTAAGLALASQRSVLIAEMDSTGGDLAAWWDLTESPGIASAITGISSSGWVTANAQRASTGILVMPSPVRAHEANSTVNEALRTVLPTLSAYTEVTAIVDAGASTHRLAPAASEAALVAIVASQIAGSPRASAAMLERTGDLVDLCNSLAIPAIVGVIGSDPYRVSDIESFTGTECRSIADDPLGAAVIAGRPATGRLATRSRLLKSLAPIADEIDARLDQLMKARP